MSANSHRGHTPQRGPSRDFREDFGQDSRFTSDRTRPREPGETSRSAGRGGRYPPNRHEGRPIPADTYRPLHPYSSGQIPYSNEMRRPGSDVARAASSDQDRAPQFESDLSSDPPPILPQPTANSSAGFESPSTVVETLSSIFQKIIAEATDYSMLKSQKNAAQKVVEKRNSEFLKFKPHHEKFPSTEESQRRGKEQAEKDYLLICDKVQTKKSSLDQLAEKSAMQIVPSILEAGADTNAQQALQSRCDRLERTLERTCEDFDKKIRDQQRIHEELDKKYRDQQSALEQFETLQHSHRELQRRCGEMEAKYRGSQKAIDELRDVAIINSKAARLSTETADDMKQKIDNLAARVDDFPNMRIELSKIKEESGRSSKVHDERYQKLEKLETTVCGDGISGGLRGYVTQLAKDQENFRRELGKWNSVDAELVAIVGRLNTIENGADQIEFEKRIGAIEHEISVVGDSTVNRIHEQLNGLREKLVPLEYHSIDTADVMRRLKSLEETLFDSPAKVSGLTGTRPDRPGAERSVSDSDKSSRITDVVHSSGQHINGSSTSSNTGLLDRTMSNLVETLKELKENFMSFKLEQEAADGITGGSITDLLSAVEALQARCTSTEDNISKMETSLSSTKHNCEQLSFLPAKLESLQQAHTSFVSGYATKTFEIIRAHPELLALSNANIEQRFVNLADSIVQVENRFNPFVATQQMLNATLDNRVEAATFGILQIGKRLDTINTMDLAMHMLSQLDTVYPNVRNAENSIVEFEKSERELKVRVQAIETRLQQILDAESSQSLQSQIDELRSILSNATSIATETKDALTTLQKQNEVDNDVIAEQFAAINVDISDLKDQHKAEVVQPVGGNNTGPPGLDRAANGDAQAPKSTSFPSSSRQASAQLSESGSKKRKALNGAITSTKINGNHINRGKKRRQKTHFSEDSEDSDFEPRQPEITDDDEDE